jgi:homoserine kinase type II
MSVFTTVSTDEARAGLRNYILGDLVELQGISDGVENPNYFLTATRGRDVLSLFEKLTEQELPSFARLMTHLATNGVPYSRPVADLSDRMVGRLNGKSSIIVSCLKGKALDMPEHFRRNLRNRVDQSVGLSKLWP